jgi:hypothetical protein
VARNKAEEKNGDGEEDAAPSDEGWVDEEGAEIPALPALPAEEVDLDNVTDPQLERAADMLRGILVYQKR